MSDADVRTAHSAFGLREAVPGRKGEILSAALEVFSEHGYEGGSMRDIASRVGVSEAALYRHYSGKEAIFLALISEVGGTIREAGITTLLDIRPLSLREDLSTLLRERRATAQLYRPVIGIVFPAIARNPAWLAQAHKELIGPVLTAVTAKVTQIDAALGVEDAEATRSGRIRALMSLVVGYVASTLVVGDEQDEEMVEIVMRMMRWDLRL